MLIIKGDIQDNFRGMPESIRFNQTGGYISSISINPAHRVTGIGGIRVKLEFELWDFPHYNKKLDFFDNSIHSAIKHEQSSTS